MKHRILIYGGLGDLGRKRLIPALNRLCKEFSLEFATVDIKPSAHGKYYEFGKEPLGEYSAAIISTPNHKHQEIAITALNAGVHLLCEKPLADTLEAAEEIIRATEKHPNLISMLSDHYVYKPAIREVIQNWERYGSRIGKLKGLETKILESSGAEGREWLLEKDKSGGGVAMDTGTHLVSIMGKLFGYDKISVRKAVIDRGKYAPGDAETYAYITLDIKNIPAEIEVGKCMSDTRKEIIFTGSKGKLEVDIEKEQIKVNGKVEASFPEDDSYPTILREFLYAIEAGKTPWTTLEDGYEALKIIKSAYEIALS